MVHAGGDLRGDRNGLVLKPWFLVAKEYTKRTGDRISEQRAQMIGREAERKLATRFGEAGITSTGEIMSTYFAGGVEKSTNREIAAEAVVENTEAKTLNIMGVAVAESGSASLKDIRKAICELLDEIRPHKH